MNIHSMFPSKFVAAGDLMDQDVTVVIASCKVEEVGTEGDKRPVLYFQGMTKGIVLNRINSKRIAAMYGAEVDAWFGRPITLYPSETEFGGETVPCIRVRPTPPMLADVQQALPAQQVKTDAVPAVDALKAELEALRGQLAAKAAAPSRERAVAGNGVRF